MKGKESIMERKKMLATHRKEIEHKIKALNGTLAFIDKENALYDKFLSGEVEYYSYLIKK